MSGTFTPPAPPRRALPPQVPEIPPLYDTYAQPKPADAYFSEAAADYAVDSIQRLVQFEGRFAGHSLRLLHWQRRLVRELFGWHTESEDGHPLRLYRKVYLEVPRKNGKSSFAAAIAIFLAYFDGEEAPQVFFAAADKDQAGIAYNMAKVLIQQDEELAGRSVIYNSTKRIKVPDNNGELRCLAGESKKLYGLNLHGLVFDELMAQPNRLLWDALTTAQGAREQPLILAITTAGWDRNTVAFEHHEYTRQISEGVFSDPAFLGICYSVDEGADWTDEETWKLAAPSLGETVSVDYYRTKAVEAQGQPSAQNSFRTLMLCQWVGQADRILPMVDWQVCDSLPLPELRGRRAFGGIDMSATTDLTAVVLDFPDCPEPGFHTWLARVFIPGDGLRERGLKDRAPYEVWARDGFLTVIPGNVIQDSYIRQAVRDLGEEYQIDDVSYDRWGMGQLARTLDEEDGFTMVKVGQGFASMSSPTKELVRLVVDHKLVTGNNPILRWMADGASGEADAAGNLKLDKSRSASRIDGLVAGLMGLDGAMRRGRPIRESIYNTQGPDDWLAEAANRP